MKKKLEETKKNSKDIKHKIGEGEKLLKRINERAKRTRRAALKLDVVASKLKRARKMSQNKNPDIHKTLSAILDFADAVEKNVKRYEEVLSQLNDLLEDQGEKIQDLQNGLLEDTLKLHKEILKGKIFTSLDNSVRIPGEEPIGGRTFYDSPFFSVK